MSEQEDEDQLRAGPMRRVRVGAGDGVRICEGDGQDAEGQPLRDIGQAE